MRDATAGGERRGSIGCVTARGLAAVRELWTTRDRIAQRRDVAPRRILPDSAIIDAALADPKTVDDLVALPVFGGRNQRRSAAMWLAALEAARESRDPPDDVEPPNGPPPPARWSKRKPEAAARLEAARAALSEVSQRVGVPTENLISPDLVRRLCWDWQAPGTTRPTPSRPSRSSCGRPGAGLAARTRGPGLAAALQPPANSGQTPRGLVEVLADLRFGHRGRPAPQPNR